MDLQTLKLLSFLPALEKPGLSLQVLQGRKRFPVALSCPRRVCPTLSSTARSVSCLVQDMQGCVHGVMWGCHCQHSAVPRAASALALGSGTRLGQDLWFREDRMCFPGLTVTPSPTLALLSLPARAQCLGSAWCCHQCTNHGEELGILLFINKST